jgi:predicted nucleic acid-binding protein
MKVFIDSSSLAKRYILERGSDQVEEIFAKATQTAISLIAPPELISALSRLRRQAVISNGQDSLVKRALFEDIEDMTICDLTVDVIKKTIGLLETHPLRTLDAIQVASALEWQAELFVSSDRRQLSAAKESGLRVRSV